MIRTTVNHFPRGIVHRRFVISTAVAALLAVPVAATATTTATRAGSFSATGVGTLVANGAFTDAFGAKLQGTLIVRDAVGGAKVRIGGVAQKAKRIKVRGKVVRVFTIRRPNKPFAFHVSGRNVRITIISKAKPLSVQIFGRGTVTRLAGEGTYTLNDDAPLGWGEAPLPLRIKPPPPVKPPRTAEATLAPTRA